MPNGMKRMYHSPSDRFGNEAHMRVVLDDGSDITASSWLELSLAKFALKNHDGMVAEGRAYLQVVKQTEEYNKQRGVQS